MNIESALYTFLKETVAVFSLVGDRIFPLLAPQGVDAPFITYQRISGARWRSNAGPSGMAQPRFQIDLYDETYEGSKAAATAIRQALDGYRGTVAGVRIGGISLISDQDMIEDAVEPKLFRVSMDFLITHAE